ncbi:uncharacterized protein LOC143559519 [Bidens hawaiensis]|uniref:uncharacterized protein LOC143559519 n=1 Tax=Bidens hawaiensis TaxID=980011 RepID=UPI00404B243E
MQPMDDIWNITSLSSPATNHFQNCFLRPPVTTTAATTMLTLFTPTTPTTNSVLEPPDKRPKHNPPPPPPPTTTPPRHSDKFRRLMKNRESAARSRARKQARADQLEHEVVRLANENAKLKRLQKQADASHVAKEPRLRRSKSAPF